MKNPTLQIPVSYDNSRPFVNAQGQLITGRNVYYIDLFCGAGGVSTGVVRAGAKVIFCINHDPVAIASHRANHPRVKHAIEDITVFDLTDLVRRVNAIRAKDPLAIICLWASLECTHFSKAKGGEHRDPDSRTLAEHLYRYIKALNPDYIDIENVTEFMSWGPLRIACSKTLSDRSILKVRKSGEYHLIPHSKKNGSFYTKWHQTICQDYGYDYDYRILNSADFGAMTARTRYFGQFKKPGLPFTWPEPTHAKKPKAGGLFGGLKPWRAVKPALDLDDQGKSIFGRKKGLSENTLKRIYAGLIKYIGNGKEPAFITKWMSGNTKNLSPEETFPTVTTMNHFGVIQTQFISKHFSGKPDQKNHPLTEPARTITTSANQSLVSPEFLCQRNSGNPKSKICSTEDPARTITQTGGNLELVSPDFLMKYHGNGDNVIPTDGPSSTLTTKDRIAKLSIVWLDKQFRSDANHQSIETPAGTILTNDKHCKMTACFIMNQYSGGGQHSDPNNPLGALTTVPKSNLIQADPWVFNHNYQNVGSDIQSPAPTLLASRKHFYLLNPQYTSKGNDLDRPCFTLIARMDKMPPYLMEANQGEGAILIYEDDSKIMKQIKLFMAIHGIVDIKMRMLKVNELLRIQGFGDQYQLKGTQTDQKRFIGNSVEVTLAKAKVKSRIDKIQSYFQSKQQVA